jgi:predicted permease
MGTILVKAISLVLIIVVGFVIKRAGWVSTGDFPKFSKIVLRITIPCILINNFNNFDITYNLLYLTAIAIVVNLIQQLAGYLINRRNNGKDKAFGIFNIGSYNVGAFAIPYISGFIGPGPVVYASLFDMGNTISAAGIGYGWAMSLASDSKKSTIEDFLKNMFKSWLFDTYIFIIIIVVMLLKEIIYYKRLKKEECIISNLYKEVYSFLNGGSNDKG